MWMYSNDGNTAINLNHVTRLFVEETGSGAALKAEIAGKTFMVAYFNSKADAKEGLRELMAKRAAETLVARIG